MPEIVSVLGRWFGKGATAVAAGKTQAQLGLQSPDLATAMTRVGRFLYISTGAWIIVTWYTAYRNERTQPGSSIFVTGGTSMPVIAPPDREDKSLPGLKKSGKGPLGDTFGTPGELAENAAKLLLPFGISYKSPPPRGRTLVALSPAQLGTPGTAVGGYLWSAPNGSKQMPAFSSTRYGELVHVAAQIANSYRLKITSGYRPQSTGSMHSVGLAFDMVGSMNSMRRAAAWAATNPGLFQEIFIHNEGSGMHLHIAFYPDAAQIVTTGKKAAPTGTPPRNPNAVLA